MDSHKHTFTYIYIIPQGLLILRRNSQNVSSYLDEAHDELLLWLLTSFCA